jgi:4-hydroxy-tetrahydrodipicolinate reductase
LKIALIGYGKMGKEIERLALARGDTIVSVSDVDSLPTTEDLAPAEVAIDFSVPDAVIHNLKLAADTGVDMVVGTTGWYDHLGEVRKWFDSSALIYAENFSIGVNLFYRVVREAARLMGGFGDYDAFVAEEHHNQKLDSPSGTSTSLLSSRMKSPVACGRAALLPRQNAQFSGWRTILTEGKVSATQCAEPSVEALSARMISRLG